MTFNDHSGLRGKHALFSPSKHYWSNYSDEQLLHFMDIADAAQRGTEDHEFARLCIERCQRLPKSKNTLTMYVNDAIGFCMTPEVCLYFSDNCYGWTDAIVFDERKNLLRIHDLKTGVQPADMQQLRLYAALYFLEYRDRHKPETTDVELRIYQNGEIRAERPEADELLRLMNVIIHCDRIAEKRKAKG